MDPKETVDHNQAALALALGIISLAGCHLFGPIAFSLAHKYKKTCIMEGVEPDGMGQAGWLLGIISTAMLTFQVLFLFFWFLLFVFAIGIQVV